MDLFVLYSQLLYIFSLASDGVRLDGKDVVYTVVAGSLGDSPESRLTSWDVKPSSSQPPRPQGTRRRLQIIIFEGVNKLFCRLQIIISPASFFNIWRLVVSTASY